MQNRLVARLGWPIVIFFLIVPVIMWCTMIPLENRFSSTYAALGSIGKLTGIVAFMLFCINVILTTRLRVIESLFGGLNKMFIAHHLTGGIALCVLLLHPIAMSMQKATFSLNEAAVLLLPRLADIPVAIGIIAFWIFVALMIVTFFISLPYKLWLFTHKFLGLVLLLIGLHVILISSDTSNNLALKTYLLGFALIATVAYAYRTLLPRFFVRRHTYQIAGISQPTPEIVRIYFDPIGPALSYKPGQFIFVSFLGAGFSHEWHPFSISSATNNEKLHITVKALGKYTEELVRLAPTLVGTAVNIEGAYGRFYFRNFKAKRQIWVAGGIGITPFLSMIKDVTPDYKIDIYYSVKSELELIDTELLTSIAAASQGNVRFIPHVSDTSGFLTLNTITTQSGNLQDCEFLLCGPPGMMHALRTQLVQAGLKKWKIHSEEFAMS